MNTIFTWPISVRDANSAGAGFGVGVNGSEQFISDYNGNRQTFTTKLFLLIASVPLNCDVGVTEP